MNTSKIDTLAMAAETRAKLHVYEAPMAMSPSAGQRAAVASSRYGVGAADVSPTIGAAALGVAQSPVKSGSRPRACSGFPSNKRKAASFAEKLHAILADRNASSTITWLPSGKSFCIMDKQEFTRRVLPLYFREAKFESFSRRLKRWGFRKVYTTGQKQIILTHDLFQKGRLDLCKAMNGRASSSQVVSQDNAPNPSSELAEELALAEKSLRARQQVIREEEAQKARAAPKASHPVPQLLTRPSQTQPVMFARTPVMPSYMHDIAMRGYSLEANTAVNYTRPFGVPAPPCVPYNVMPTDVEMRQLSDLDIEIAECKEQLMILQRLRALREKRRVLS